MGIASVGGALSGDVGGTAHIAPLRVTGGVVGEVLLRVVVAGRTLARFNLLGDTIFAGGLFIKQ